MPRKLQIVRDPGFREDGKKLFRLTDDEARVHFLSFCPPSDYVPGVHPLKDQLLLQRTHQAWEKLGLEKGFQWETVEPHPSLSPLLFYAFPLEPEECPTESAPLKTETSGSSRSQETDESESKISSAADGGSVPAATFGNGSSSTEEPGPAKAKSTE